MDTIALSGGDWTQPRPLWNPVIAILGLCSKKDPPAPKENATPPSLTIRQEASTDEHRCGLWWFDCLAT